jgi:hypothetical protein
MLEKRKSNAATGLRRNLGRGTVGDHHAATGPLPKHLLSSNFNVSIFDAIRIVGLPGLAWFSPVLKTTPRRRTGLPTNRPAGIVVYRLDGTGPEFLEA